MLQMEFSTDSEMGNFDLGFFSSPFEPISDDDDLLCVEALDESQQSQSALIFSPRPSTSVDNDGHISDSDSEYDPTFAGDRLTEPQPSTSRGPTFVAIEEDQFNFVNRMKNKNTVRKTESVLKTFSNWLESAPNFETHKVEEIPPIQLNNYVGNFLLSIRKHDGTEYEPDTLTSYHRGIDRYLRERNYPTSMVFGEEFKSSRDVLVSKRKELKQKGKGNRPNKSAPLTANEQTILREKGVIGDNSPRALQNLVWLNNTVHFGLRGRDENRKLKWGDIFLHTDERGVEFLQFNERDTKTRNGENVFGHQRSFQPKQFATGNKENCPVVAFKKFKALRPPQMCNPDSPFYLSVNHQRKPGSSKWYKAQAMGKNFLNNVMKRMAERGNFTGKKTNHSARATTATRLLHAGVPPTTIVQLTGHKNLASLNNYATASHEQQQEMSNILSLADNNNINKNNENTYVKQICGSSRPNEPAPFPVAIPSTSTISLPDMTAPPQGLNYNASHSTTMSSIATSHSKTMAGVFQGATFNNCTLNINFSSSS